MTERKSQLESALQTEGFIEIAHINNSSVICKLPVGSPVIPFSETHRRIRSALTKSNCQLGEYKIEYSLPDFKIWECEFDYTLLRDNPSATSDTAD